MDDPDSVADIMEKLINSNESQTLMAYQLSFDLYENASQQFLARIRNALKALAPLPLAEPEQQGDTVKKEEPKEG